MIIDVHTHIFSPEISERRDHYCSQDECFGLLYSNSKAKLCQVEDLIKSMDDNGITKSVILNIGWVNHEFCIRNNDYIIESISRYPDRLMGFCSVQPLERDKAAAEVERCLKAGLKGIGELRPDVQGYDLCNDELMSPLVDIIRKNSALIAVHVSEPVGHHYNGKGQITPDVLFNFIEKYSDINMILAHFGGGLPFYELMPEVNTALNHTYYDTAAAPFLYDPGIYSIVNQICGNTRLLFGSDWPLLDQSRVIKHISSAGMNQTVLESILYQNSATLFDVDR